MVLGNKSNLISFLFICLLIVGTLAVIDSVNANEIDGSTSIINLNDLNEDICSDESDLEYVSSSNSDSSDLDDSNIDNPELSYKGSDSSLEGSDDITVYVSNSGNDSHSGINPDNAFLTIDKALETYYENNKSINIYLDEGTFTSLEKYQVFNPEDDGNHLISIIGSGVNKTVLDGQGLHNIFYIESGMSVLLKDLTLVNGYDSSAGGAIFNEGNLTLINTYFYNNKVHFPFSSSSFGTIARGGAIFNGGNLNIESSSFIKNQAGDYLDQHSWGGAIFNDGKLLINNSVFNYNDINSRIDYSLMGTISSITAYQKGASIASLSGDVSISNTSFYNNILPVLEKSPGTYTFYSFSAGAALYLEGDNYDIINCSFVNNTADVAGAVYHMGNNINFENCKFINNSAYRGGVIVEIDYGFNDNYYNFKDFKSNKYANLTIKNCNFIDNFIKIFVNGNGISSNALAGVGFLKMDNISIFNSTFKNNGFLIEDINNNLVMGGLNAFLTSAGALKLLGQNSIVNKSTFINNRGENGGAILNYGFDTIINDTIFINNTAYLGDGGAIYHSIGDLLVDNCIFDSNNASKNGGSIQAGYDYTNNYIFEQKSVYNNSKFINSISEYGGAIFDTGNAVIFENLEFINNSAFYGGAVYKQGFSNSFLNSTFINNSALTKDYSNGGALYNYGANVLIDSCTFINNSADLYGGAVFNFGDSSNIFNNTFDSNDGFSGGSVYLSGNGGRFADNDISSSFAVYGGGLYNAVTNLICLNNSFDDCKANVSGGAIYNLVSTLQLSANSMDNCQASLSGVGSGNYVFTCGNISYLVISFLNNGTLNMVDNQSVLLFANVTDNMGNPITGGNVSFILFNSSDDSSFNPSSIPNGGESTIIGIGDLIEGIAYLKFNIPLDLGSNYAISGSYSYGAEPISTQIGNLRAVLATRIFLSSDMEDNTVPLGENFSYEMILLDSEDNYLANAEILVYLDGVYYKSVFTNDVGYVNETSSIIPSSGKHYLDFIYEGDVFHNRGTANLNFTVFYNNTYYYDDIVISFTDLAYSIVHTSPNSEIPYQFIIYHNKTGEVLANVSTYRYFLAYRNDDLFRMDTQVDYLGQVVGQTVLYSIVSYNGKLTKVYRTSPEGIFEFPIMESEPGLYEYRIEFLGDLVKHFDPSTHNNINEEDNIYNPCNISFILIVDGSTSNVPVNLTYEGPNAFSEVDLPYYQFNLTDKNGNPLVNSEILIYDNGSYVGSALTDGSGFAEYQFEEYLDLGKHLLEFIYVGEGDYSSTYKIIDLNVFENPYKGNIIFSNKSSLNVTGPNNSFKAQLKDFYNNNLSNFTIKVEVITHDFGNYDKNRFSRNYTVITDENGIFSIPLELGAGVYQINCSYAGSKWYFGDYRIFNLNLTKAHTLLMAQSSIEVLKNDSYLTVILTTDDFKVLSNQKITYYVISDDYNTTYYAFTNESSISRLKINLPVGKYSLISAFDGDKWYENCSLLTNLTIYGDKSKLDANENIIIKESGYYSVKLLDSKDLPIVGQTINITVNGKSYSRITDSNGEARLEINLDYGNYTITSSFRGNINYTSSSVSSNLYVVDKNYKYPSLLTLNSSEIYRSQGYYEVILTGINHEGLAHKNIIVNVNGTNYTIRTNNDGLAHLDYDFSIGSYRVTAYFAGDTDYQYSNLTSTLTVVSENAATTLLNSSVYYVLKGKGGFYTVTLLDKIGNPISGQRIYFNINGKEYSNLTNSNGDANLRINLDVGSYDVDSYFRGTDVYFASNTFSKLVILPLDNESNGSNVVDNNVNKTVNKTSSTVKLSTKIVASNIVKYYKDSKKLTITLKDSKGKIVAGRSLSITLNGKTYNGATDKKGKINLVINLKKGSYAVKIKFAGDKQYKASSKKVTVKVVYPKINPVKTTVKRNKKLQVKFLTYKGKAIKNQKVSIKLKGKTYTVKTNSKGIASLKIKVKKGTYKVKLAFKNTKTYGKYTKTIKLKVK